LALFQGVQWKNLDEILKIIILKLSQESPEVSPEIQNSLKFYALNWILYTLKVFNQQIQIFLNENLMTILEQLNNSENKVAFFTDFHQISGNFRRYPPEPQLFRSLHPMFGAVCPQKQVLFA
jgi:hypothetical protein